MSNFIEFIKRHKVIVSIIIAIVVIAGLGLSIYIVFGSNNVSGDVVEVMATKKPEISITKEPTKNPGEWIVNEYHTLEPTPTVTSTEEPTEEPTLAPTVKPTAKVKKTPRPTLKPELAAVTVKPNDTEDPGNQESAAQELMGSGENITVNNSLDSNTQVAYAREQVAGSNTLSEEQISSITDGIDVSSHNGKIDWKKVAAAGVDFAMVRIGYRGYVYGTIVEDTYARANLEGAIACGIKVGAYFFSTAMSEEEGKDEATWACDFLSNYNIDYPIAYDCEQYNNPDYRNYGTTSSERTKYALAFLSTVKSEGYTPMFYNCSNALAKEWDTGLISSKYKIWKANYGTSEKLYKGVFSMFQYTSSGAVDGISGRVDLNAAYMGDLEVKTNKIISYGMVFTETNETVYVNKTTNIRSVPSTASEYTIIAKEVPKGTKITRIGIGNKSWDRIKYNDEIAYVYKSNITTEERWFATPKPLTTSTPTPSASVLPSATEEGVIDETISSVSPKPSASPQETKEAITTDTPSDES